MNPNYSNFKIELPQWVKNIGGGVAGSSVGIGFESLGFLVGIPLAGTGFWTYASACKGDKGCTKRVQDWWNKNKPEGQKISNNEIDEQYTTGNYDYQQYQQQTSKPINWKPYLYVGGGLLAAFAIGYFIYKASK